MTIRWGLGDAKAKPHVVESIRPSPGHGYAASLRPEGSPYTSGVMLYPHISYEVISVPHPVAALEALDDWQTSYWMDGVLYCADHPGEEIDRDGCRLC